MTGLSEASMHVDDARRYSRRIGFSRCDRGYGQARQPPRQQGFDLEFVNRIDDRPKQADGDRLRLGIDQAVEHGLKGGLVKRLDDASVAPNPFGGLEGKRARHVRLWKRFGIVE